MERARDLWEDSLGATHLRVTTATYNLGIVQGYKKDHAKALQTQNDALRRLDQREQDAPEVRANILAAQGDQLFALARYEQAEQLTIRALELFDEFDHDSRFEASLMLARIKRSRSLPIPPETLRILNASSEDIDPDILAELGGREALFGD